MSETPTGTHPTTVRPPRVALVNMPFSSTQFPSIPLGLLQATLRRLTIPRDACCLNVAFATETRWNACGWFCKERKRFASEWVPSQAASGETVPASYAFLNTFLDGLAVIEAYTGCVCDRLCELHERVARAYIESCLEDVSRQRYNVAGLDSM